MKQLFIFLITILVFSCKSKPEVSEKANEVKPPDIVDTGHGIHQELIAPVDSTYLLNATYCNTRYGFCISYATVDVKMEAEPDSGDGCIFTNNDGEEFGRVYRRANADPESNTYPLRKA